MAKKHRFSGFRRDIEKSTVEQSESILIVCEGMKTEPLYFRCFEVFSARVAVVGTGRNTESLVDYAIQKKSDYDVVWCVFDKDSFSNQQFNNACRKAEAHGIKAAYSNQSFELWYLLHFQFLESQLDRKQYIQKLNALFRKRFNKSYQKNAEDTYRLLKPYQATAVAGAKKLMCSYDLAAAPAEKFPATSVYALVEHLNQFSRENRWQNQID